MKPINKLTITLLTLFAISGCKDKTVNITKAELPDFSDNYKYFPETDGHEWSYETILIDSVSGITTKLNEVAKYNPDSSRIDYYRNDQLWSYAYWTNANNQLRCCGDRVLIDYGKLACQGDSLLIYEADTKDLIQIQIYQFCGDQFASAVDGYTDVKCIKTYQINHFESGNTLTIVQYFGYEVGLLYRKQTSSKGNGKVLSIEIQKLTSHNF